MEVEVNLCSPAKTAWMLQHRRERPRSGKLPTAASELFDRSPGTQVLSTVSYLRANNADRAHSTLGVFLRVQ